MQFYLELSSFTDVSSYSLEMFVVSLHRNVNLAFYHTTDPFFVISLD